MKVLYILNAAFMGGATISFINMLNGLMKKGVIPFIVIPRFGPTDKDFMDYLNANNIQYYKAFLRVEPYCNYSEIKQRIQEELKKYE